MSIPQSRQSPNLFFTMAIAVLMELLARPGRLVSVQSHLVGVPHPVRAVRQRASRTRRYAQAEAGLHGPQQGDWLVRLEDEHDNVRAALAWSLDAGSTGIGNRWRG